MAERIDADSLRKGLSWEGQAACLTIHFACGQAEVELAIDGATTAGDMALAQMAQRMLGLRQPIAAFERRYRAHPLLGPLIACNPGLRVPQTTAPFEALTWAITGQQISVSAATSVRRKLILAAGLRHSSGLWCYPDARRVAAMAPEVLRQSGLSPTKARTIRELSEHIAQHRLPLDTWVNAPSPAAIHANLIQIRGIGPWTTSYALLRGFGCMDGSLAGDVAVRRKLRSLLGVDDNLTEQFTACWLAEFSPWRALVAAHLWASGKPQ